MKDHRILLEAIRYAPLLGTGKTNTDGKI